MSATSRIDDLRRRVDLDPASIAFAQLAEEYRRAGDCEEAVRVARAGLVHLPGYLSARVTLGRALLQLGAIEEARIELEAVLAAAPDNLAAVRTMAEIHEIRRAGGAAPASSTQEAPPGELALEQTTVFAEPSVDPPPPAEPEIDELTAFLDQLGQFADDGRVMESDARLVALDTALTPDAVAATSPSPSDLAARATLERWLAAIVADRTARG